MEAVPKKRAYTKSRLIKELAFRAGITQNQSRAALEAIIEIAYREAKANYFILPGLCKFDVVRRAPRNVRNPVTGEQLVLPERDTLHVVLSKRAKETVAPKVAPMKLEEFAALTAAKKAEEEAAAKKAEEEAAAKKAEEEAAAKKAAEEAAAKKAAEEAAAKKAAEEAAIEPKEVAGNTEAVVAEALVEQAADATVEQAPAEAEPETPSDMPTLAEAAAAKAEQRAAEGFIDAPEVKGDQAISFKCTTCGQEIVAPMETVGYEAECPACGAILLVPDKSEPGTTYAPGGEAEKKEMISVDQVEDLNPEALKNRTIRIDTMLFGEDDNSATAKEAKNADSMKSRTMRIDLPDEF